MCIWNLNCLGKTAGFMLPILERLLYRPTHTRVSRVLILTPTRELAIQVRIESCWLNRRVDVNDYWFYYRSIPWERLWLSIPVLNSALLLVRSQFNMILCAL